MKGKNIPRFLAGLGGLAIMLLAAVVLVLVLRPFVAAAGFSLLVCGVPLFLAIAVAYILALVWYLTRIEEERGDAGEYTIKQGREV